ncbi:hypothetical protein L6R53_01565 [Myxococcota bacterium]|nr:hypothetical protein [Myxococcota bacterium]
MRHHHPRWPLGRRRGNYSLMLAAAVIALLGFGALSIDVAYMRLSQAQAQDIADAASQAALIVLRQTGDQAQAQDAAMRVINDNSVAGQAPDLVEITFGNWDDQAASPAFTVDPVVPNAVRVTVGREGGSAIPVLLARIWDYEDFEVRASAVSATRSFQIVFVLDITGSWGEAKFADAREAMLAAHSMVTESASGVDEVGMTIFTNRYAWEYTPLTQIAIPANAAAIKTEWEKLNIASKAPVGSFNANAYDGVNCDSSYGNDFNSPQAGGCYPDMPREYTDEPGTDHSTGVLLAKQMFEESSTGAVYRAMIVITDGKPNDLGASSGAIRITQGYTEDRWREYLGPVPRSKTDIRNATVAATLDLWNGLDVHTWAVTLVQDDPMLDNMLRGDGYKVIVNDSSQLTAVISEIISEMPLAIVE